MREGEEGKGYGLIQEKRLSIILVKGKADTLGKRIDLFKNLLIVMSLGAFAAGLLYATDQPSEVSLCHSIAEAIGMAHGGDSAEALSQLGRILSLSRSVGSITAKSKSLLWLAILEWDFGDIEKSLRHFDEAREAFRTSGDKCSASFCNLCLRIVDLYLKGQEQRVRGEYERSESCYRQAILLSRETGWYGFELKCLRQSGMISWDLKRWDEFRDKNLAALAIARALRYSHEEGRCLNNIGAFFQKTGLYAQASSYLDMALKKARQVSDLGTEAECLNNLGLLYRELGNYVTALRFLSSAYEIDARLGDSSAMAIDKSNMAAVLLRKGITDKNAVDLKDSLDLYRTNIDSGHLGPYQEFVALNNMGVVLNEQGRTVEARDVFIQSIAVLDAAGFIQEKGAALNNIATTYLYEGRYEEARRGYGSAQESSWQDPLSVSLLESYVGMGQCLEGLRDFPGALECYRTATEIFDRQVSRISSDYFMIGYARNRYGAYHKMLRILSDEYLQRPSEQLIEEILRIIERAKGKAFLEGLGKSPRSGGAWGPLSDLGSMRALLPDKKTLALEYYIAEDRSYLVTISPRTLHLHILPDRKEIARSLRGFIRLLPDPGMPLRLSLSANDRIVNILIPQSLAMEMNGYERLVIMPDGILSYLPFEVLRVRSGREAIFLIEQLSVSYSPSLSVLSILKRRNSAGRDTPIMAIGAIQYSAGWGRETISSTSNPADSFRDLPHSRNEINHIKSLFSGNRVRTLTGWDVNERNVKALRFKGYGVLHFACHGYVDEIDPLRTALVLTSGPSDGEDGFLRIEEIASLETDANLVVLSSCRSGSGVLENGEGLLSLARPFFFAGARSVLATLWPIYDKSTASFMGEFYKYVAKGQGPGEALRNAKVKMIKSSLNHPFFWAGYVLNGMPIW